MIERRGKKGSGTDQSYEMMTSSRMFSLFIYLFILRIYHTFRRSTVVWSRYSSPYLVADCTTYPSTGIVNGFSPSPRGG